MTRELLNAILIALGILSENPAFARRRLGLGSGRLTDHQRLLARLWLLETRALALRLVLRKALLAGERGLFEAYPELTARVLGVSLRSETALALFRLHADDAQHLSGIWLAGAEAERLLQVHDEDWFRNPRAVEELRANAEALPALDTNEAELTASSAHMLNALRAAL